VFSRPTGSRSHFRSDFCKRSNYLLESGKPEIIYRRGRFQKALGVAPTHNSSGDKKSKSIVGGSDLCRIPLWQWIFTRIEVRRNRPKNEIGKI
jgi:hypothetical protein